MNDKAKNQRTPGPWKIAPLTCLYKIDDKNKAELCEQRGFSVSFEAIGISDDDGLRTLAIVPLDDSNEANARLIAAAPEFLDLSKRLLCEVWLVRQELNEAMLPMLKTLEELRQLIQKTED